jgi:hypothetical protein
MTHIVDRAGRANPLTVAIDVGGSHLKAAVLERQERYLQVRCVLKRRSRQRRTLSLGRWLTSHNGSASLIASRSASRAWCTRILF